MASSSTGRVSSPFGPRDRFFPGAADPLRPDLQPEPPGRSGSPFLVRAGRADRVINRIPQSVCTSNGETRLEYDQPGPGSRRPWTVQPSSTPTSTSGTCPSGSTPGSGTSRPRPSATATRARSAATICRPTTGPTRPPTTSRERSTSRRSGTRPTRSGETRGSTRWPHGKASPAPWPCRSGWTGTTSKTCWRARPSVPWSAASATSLRPRRLPTRPCAGALGSMGDPRWRAGFSRLARYGLSFDLQTPWWHLHEQRRRWPACSPTPRSS